MPLENTGDGSKQRSPERQTALSQVPAGDRHRLSGIWAGYNPDQPDLPSPDNEHLSRGGNGGWQGETNWPSSSNDLTSEAQEEFQKEFAEFQSRNLYLPQEHMFTSFMLERNQSRATETGQFQGLSQPEQPWDTANPYAAGGIAPRFLERSLSGGDPQGSYDTGVEELRNIDPHSMQPYEQQIQQEGQLDQQGQPRKKRRKRGKEERNRLEEERKQREAEKEEKKRKQDELWRQELEQKKRQTEQKKKKEESTAYEAEKASAATVRLQDEIRQRQDKEREERKRKRQG